ncbi:MAG TPA: UDP-2,3-diacylglucosamine diphosphatase [Burkholderiales bacterium]|nr:UDP-2,3-diacylglucosamine diphosphatase [Burkholderiales bacterium]
MDCTFFISDLHLNEGSIKANEALMRFLEGPAPQADAIYILGDLFEYWVGDDMLLLPFYREVADRLEILNRLGVRLYFQHGNRDFLIGEEFARHCGITLLPELQVLELYGKSTLIMHGDLLCTTDVDYQNARRFLRSPVWQQAFLRKSLDERLVEAGALRQKSEAAKKMKAMEIMDVHPPEVERVLCEQDVTSLIHGHTHRMNHHRFYLGGNMADRWVLPDWDVNGGFLHVSAKGSKFVSV